MSTSASSSDAPRDGSNKDGNAAGGPGSGAPPTAAAAGAAGGGVKKTNVCLICGIYTTSSLNIFEPRNGPNIREVIYQKYNFRAERSDTEDKYICFSCNNWLINWYSLQHLSESRNYESTPSSSRQSQSENRNKRPKNNGRSSSSNTAPGSSRDKENLEQENVVSSTVKTPEKENASPKRKPKRPPFGPGRPVLKQSSQQNLISSSTNSSSSSTLVKPFESHLIRMLENQGTTVIKESKLSAKNPFNQTHNPPFSVVGKRSIQNPPSTVDGSANSNSEIILSFNSAISEVVNVLPSLKDLHQNPSTSSCCNEDSQVDHVKIDEHFLRTHRMSRSLSISLIDSATMTTTTIGLEQ